MPYRFDVLHYQNPLIVRALEMWDEDKLDREWIVRNILGGMAAGFGLRGKEILFSRDLLVRQSMQWCWIVTQFSRL